MVQDRLEAHAGTAFVHGFTSSMVVPASKVHNLQIPADIEMSMRITHPDGTSTTFQHGSGLVEGYMEDGTVVIVCSVHEPKNLGIGEHSFHVTAQDAKKRPVLDQQGTLVVSEGQDHVNVDTPTWFDPFTPAITDPESFELPPPEIPVEIRDSRMSICEGCPELKEDMSCVQCGCFMPLKTGLADAFCPLGKWGVHV